ncbi:hypothetical protein CYMTET_11882 [Cymbomonas tetramitiformis]|uniref:Uncharacterized protein n=1 Tax=Cymbomonas tetramitiformis TaxID=36881 RepID=A0AAE0GLH0_9CHLO|nr:hypothetical protein CYMTET_11882 [Cymbomonas tetramitiformis]
MGPGQRQFDDFGDSEEEDESEYPVGYFDDSEDDLEEEEGCYGHLACAPHFSTLRLEQDPELDTDYSLVEPLPEHTGEHFEDDKIPEAAFAEGEELDDDYTAEEWAAWDAGAYDAQGYGGAREEFAEHFVSYDGEEYYSDDY